MAADQACKWATYIRAALSSRMQFQLELAPYVGTVSRRSPRFEICESEAPELREAMALRQRGAGDMIGQLLWTIG